MGRPQGRLPAAAIMLLLATLMVSPALAAVPESAPEEALARAAPPAVPARKLALFAKDIDLPGSAAEFVLPFVLPPDEPFERATLDLTYSNALAVLPDRSGMAVTLNGKPLTTLPMIGAQGDALAGIDLPGKAFRPGRNELTFQLRQAHRLACSREHFQELWTRLKAKDSGLVLHRSQVPAPARSGAITGYLAASFFDGEGFAIATGSSLAGPAGIELGSRVAQAVALTRGDRPLPVEAIGWDELGWTSLRGRNIALIGTTGELAALLDPADLAVLEEGRMLVRPLPADPDHVALLFAGADPAAIGQAIDGFVAMAARPLDPPPLVRIDGAAELKLSQIGFESRELPIGTTEPMLLRFRLPPTFYAADGQRLELVLNYAYAAGLTPTSALMLAVNGIPANMIRLDDPRGRIVDGARINLTLGMFHPGLNTIAIQPMLDPLSEATCAKDGPVLSLFEDSRLAMPEFARMARGGELHDLVDDGFPYGDQPADVLVSSRDPEAVGAVWTLLGKLAQRRGDLLGKLAFVPPGTIPSGHLIAAGQADELSPSLVAKLDLPWHGHDDPTPIAGMITAPVAASAPDPRERWKSRIDDADRTLFDRIRRIVVRAADAEVASQTPVRPAIPPAPGSGTMLVEVASPWAPQAVATVLVADRSEHLAPGLAKLIEEPLWSSLGGDRAMWQADTDMVVGEQRNPPFALHLPERDVGQWRLATLTWLAQNRWTWLALMLLGLASASLATSLALRLRRH